MGLGGNFRFVEGSGNSSERYKDDFIHDVWLAANWNKMWRKLAENRDKIKEEFETKEDQMDRDREDWEDVYDSQGNYLYTIHYYRDRNEFPGWGFSDDVEKYLVNPNPGNQKPNVDRSLITASIYNEAWNALSSLGFTPNISSPISNTVILHSHPIALEDAMTDFFALNGATDFSHPNNFKQERV